jgi:hypothetical protein
MLPDEIRLVIAVHVGDGADLPIEIGDRLRSNPVGAGVRTMSRLEYDPGRRFSPSLLTCALREVLLAGGLSGCRKSNASVRRLSSATRVPASAGSITVQLAVRRDSSGLSFADIEFEVAGQRIETRLLTHPEMLRLFVRAEAGG